MGQGVEVFEINLPNRSKRRLNGKSDPADAENGTGMAQRVRQSRTSHIGRHGLHRDVLQQRPIALHAGKSAALCLCTENGSNQHYYGNYIQNFHGVI